MRRAGIIFAVIVVAFGVFSSMSASATVPGVNQRINLSYTGSQTLSGGGGIVSANGRMVVYSGASNTLPSGGYGVFTRNLDSGAVTRINASASGVVANTGVTADNISGSGRYVLFHTTASNLIDGTTITSSVAQLYLKDTVNGATTLISQTPSGVMSNGTKNIAVGVSSDGRFVAFTTNATNLSPDSTDGTPHLYMVDRVNNSLSIIDRKTDGTVAATSNTWWPKGAMSCDGSMIVFQHPSNLIVDDSTYQSHLSIWLLDRRGNDERIANLSKIDNAAMSLPSISCNGDYIGFRSDATNIDPSVSVPYSYHAYRPYVYDRVNGVYHFVAVTTSGVAVSTPICGTAYDYDYRCVQVSDNGVATFHATDSALTGNSGSQVYIRNINAGTTELISRDGVGSPGNGDSSYPSISADGRLIVYGSNATNLVPGDTNGNTDVFSSQTGY